MFVNTLYVRHNVIVRVANHGQAQGAQYPRSLSIVFDRIGMTFAVDFDHEAQFGTVEIDDVPGNRLLAEKLAAGKLS
jgi:hypothetical protein